jgi:hypothetical protein
MGLFDNGIKVGTGLAIGIGALILAPAVIPGLAAVVKPIAKATIKSGLILVEKTMVLIAEAKETLEDLTAEAQAELADESAQMASTVPGAGEL